MAIIVAGMGRCGTTTIYQMIINHLNINFEFRVHFPSNIQDNQVIKTHSFPNPNFKNKNCKIIWIFGNPLNIMQSLILKDKNFLRLHLIHMNQSNIINNKSSEDIIYNMPIENIIKNDVFRLKEQFENWYKQQAFDFMSIRYETMWKYQKEINNYLGLDLVWTQQIQRRADWEQSKYKELLVETFGELAEKTKEAEDIKLWNI